MLKKDNIITKFRKLWNSLNILEREQLWDILSAMRGNDLGLHDDVKFATTARIRGELLGGNYHRGYTFPTFKRAKEEINWTKPYKPHEVKANYRAKPAHFRQHIKQAIQALNCYRPKSSMRDLQKFLRD